MITGATMGTSYHITYIPQGNKNTDSTPAQIKSAVDSLLVAFNNSVSTYIPASIISKANLADSVAKVDPYFVSVFERAKEVSERTNGAFDITVMPLVNAWGFGYSDSLKIDSIVIDSLLQFIGYKNVKLFEMNGEKFLHKNDKRIQVDFSAIAKGYGVDLVGLLLEQRGIKNYMVEIGGEVRTKGQKEEKQHWRIGIENPVDNAAGTIHELNSVLKMENKSLATSGNYRNFYYREGKKISHEIDPGTGYPAQNNLLSATVIANDCMTADAFATAFMVMGLDKTIAYLQLNNNLDAYLIFADEQGNFQTWASDGIKNQLIEKE
jgi:thiamine biosynthesis lipoprotein